MLNIQCTVKLSFYKSKTVVRTTWLRIEVYFESLCPDSSNFIKYQLYPAWDLIKNHVDIRFIPFGKSKSYKNGLIFHCQHGQRECEGNKMMSCGLSRLIDQTDQVRFIECFMTAFKKVRWNKNEFGRQCFDQIGLSFENLANCYESEEGINLQLEAEILTNMIKPAFVPTVVYNGIFNQHLQDASQISFRMVVCKLLSQTRQIDC
ncbi:GILT-like protein 1 isoform X2 [Onthophagus taurus]|uniref:GILT-like protein 1 isoform X2 n=1 Tax=Onthophagus taurus TaxID=166361 RepID=UPI000C204DFB|nr:GILT-like protein 1 isoform X2 [Onthophagus taurus]